MVNEEVPHFLYWTKVKNNISVNNHLITGHTHLACGAEGIGKAFSLGAGKHGHFGRLVEGDDGMFEFSFLNAEVI
jgi:hypothetical protein